MAWFMCSFWAEILCVGTYNWSGMYNAETQSVYRHVATAVVQWLRYSAADLKVVVSIPAAAVAFSMVVV